MYSMWMRGGANFGPKGIIWYRDISWCYKPNIMAIGIMVKDKKILCPPTSKKLKEHIALGLFVRPTRVVMS